MTSMCSTTISALAFFLRSLAIAVLDIRIGDGSGGDSSCCRCCLLLESTVSGVVAGSSEFGQGSVSSAVEFFSISSSRDACPVLFEGTEYLEGP